MYIIITFHNGVIYYLLQVWNHHLFSIQCKMLMLIL